jgi:hypothetical protein
MMVNSCGSPAPLPPQGHRRRRVIEALRPWSAEHDDNRARTSVGHRQREITQISRRPISRDAKRAALRRPYRRLLATTRRVLRQAEQTVKRARRRWQRLPGKARRGGRTTQRVIELGRRVVAQTKLRIFKGITKSPLARSWFAITVCTRATTRSRASRRSSSGGARGRKRLAWTTRCPDRTRESTSVRWVGSSGFGGSGFSS